MQEKTKMTTQIPQASNAELWAEMVELGNELEAPGMLILVPVGNGWRGAYNFTRDEMEIQPDDFGGYGFQSLVSRALSEHRELEDMDEAEALYEILVCHYEAHAYYPKKLAEMLESDDRF
jgi:hypothetical protein